VGSRFTENTTLVVNPLRLAQLPNNMLINAVSRRRVGRVSCLWKGMA
jgi:hypothetical protein